jgi:hypothetical protein
MGGKTGNVAETPQQRAMADHAMNLYADWKQRWLPVQQNLSNQIQRMGKEGSFARETATGRAATDTGIQFSRAESGLESGLSNTGAKVGSSKFNLGVTGLSEDKAKSRGLGMVSADQMIDDAYMQGLGALTAVGRGERATVTDSLGAQAQESARQATADAAASLTERAGNAKVIGQLAGYGMQQYMSMPASQPVGSVPGGYRADGAIFNNPSAYTPPGG